MANEKTKYFSSQKLKFRIGKVKMSQKIKKP